MEFLSQFHTPHMWQQITHSSGIDILCQPIRELFTSDCHHLGRNKSSNYIQKHTSRPSFKVYIVFLLSRQFSCAIIRVSRKCLHVCRQCLKVSRQCLDVFRHLYMSRQCLVMSWQWMCLNNVNVSRHIQMCWHIKTMSRCLHNN